MSEFCERRVSPAIIRRLPKYYRYLGELEAQGVERISSNDFSELMGVTASQFRQDLNNFGGFGQQGYGYNVTRLRDRIGHILGIDSPHNVVVVGAGNLGRALGGYPNFKSYGYKFLAMFDKDSAKIGTEYRGLKIYSTDELKDFIAENDVELVVLALPKEQARVIAETLCDTQIKGILNFAHTDLKVRPGITVHNVHLSDDLMQLTYHMLNNESEKDLSV